MFSVTFHNLTGRGQRWVSVFLRHPCSFFMMLVLFWAFLNTVIPLTKSRCCLSLRLLSLWLKLLQMRPQLPSWDLVRRIISYINQSLAIFMTVLLSYLLEERAELVKPMKAFHTVFYWCDTMCVTWRLPYLPQMHSSGLVLRTHAGCCIPKRHFPWWCWKWSLKAQPRTDLSTNPSLGPEPEGCLAVLGAGRGMFGWWEGPEGGGGGEERFIITNCKLCSFLPSLLPLPPDLPLR